MFGGPIPHPGTDEVKYGMDGARFHRIISTSCLCGMKTSNSPPAYKNV